MMRSALVVATLAAFACPLAQAQTPAAELLADKDVPKIVTSSLHCAKPSGPVTVRAFAGGFVFSQPCPTGTETPERLVYATDRSGTGAHLLQFHRPEGRRVSALSDVNFRTTGNEIAGTVGRLSRRICRAEGAWRLEGKILQPALTYWRQTRDCDGKTGWQTLINRKR